MKFLSKLALVPLVCLTSTTAVNANIYRIDFNYGNDPDPGETGSLTGFMTIDLSQGSGTTQIQQDLGVIAIPSWITSISLTFDPDSGVAGDEETTTSFNSLNWDLKTVNVNNFDINSDFVRQMDGFGFFTNFGGDYSIASASFNQQQLPSNSEYPLQSTSTTPGGLPLLGIASIILFYKKLKNNSYKL